MSKESSLSLLHDYHAAWERGDQAAGIAFFAEDVTVHMGGNGPLAGEYLGRAAFENDWINRVGSYVDTWEVGGQNEVLLVGDDGVLLMVHEVWTKGDKRVETDRLGLYKFGGGQIVECWFSDMNQIEVESFFGNLE
ncbi:nuclear transport factor 2 family protein [bacterium RCC_150]